MFDSTSLSSLELYCGSDITKTISKPCSTLRVPQSWRRKIDDDIPKSIAEIARTSKIFISFTSSCDIDYLRNSVGNKKLFENVMIMMEHGLLRYRNVTGDRPRRFCWEKG